MLSVVTFKWKPLPGYRSLFSAEHVNTLRRMVARNYLHPHQFICVTDDAEGIEPGIKTIPLWNDFADLKPPQGGKNPACYRRLKVFSRDIGATLGERFVVMDLDAVITGDLSPVWHRAESFVMWGGTHTRTPYNGSMVLMTAGARPQVWEKFHPVRSPQLAKDCGFHGSDQAWISACLGPSEAKWTTMDGVFSFRNHIHDWNKRLPVGARIVFFHGQLDPWHPGVMEKYDWVKANYR